MSSQASTAPLWIHLPASASENAVDDISSVWAPDIHVGDPDGARESWFQPGPNPKMGVVESNQQTEDVFFSVACDPHFKQTNK